MSITQIFKCGSFMSGDNARRRIVLRVFVPSRYASKKPESPDKNNLKPLTIAERTINLAKQKSYTEKPKMCPPPPPPSYCPQDNVLPDRKPPRAKKIKVCSSEDLKKMCIPPPDCNKREPEVPPGSLAGSILRFSLFILKAIIAGGVVYWTIYIGLWGDQDDTMAIYHSIHKAVANKCEHVKMPKVGVPQIPRTDEMLHSTVQHWNSGVVYVFSSIANAPNKLLAMMGMAPKQKECEHPPVIIKPDPPQEEDDEDC